MQSIRKPVNPREHQGSFANVIYALDHMNSRCGPANMLSSCSPLWLHEVTCWDHAHLVLYFCAFARRRFSRAGAGQHDPRHVCRLARTPGNAPSRLRCVGQKFLHLRDAVL